MPGSMPLTRTDAPDAGQSMKSWRSIRAYSAPIALILLEIWAPSVVFDVTGAHSGADWRNL